MFQIDPSVLKKLRDDRGLTQDKLAKKSKIDKQTISRLERGERKQTRQRIVEALCAVFKVDAAALAGEVPVPKQQPQDHPWELKSQLNVRVDNAVRNALLLVASRYNIRASQIIELAPFVFLWAAEESLRRRRDRLAELECRLSEAEKLRDQFPHLSHKVGYFPAADDAIAAEKKSIEARDLFGLIIGGADFDDALREDFEEDTQNPLVVFLRDIAEQFGNVAEFERWYPFSSPDYRICPDEAAELVGGDRERADEILCGSVALHEMPKEIREADLTGDRAKWVKSKAEETRKRINEAFPVLAELSEKREPAP